jgi:Spy/CpxP family protein refolding chaperone
MKKKLFIFGIVLLTIFNLTAISTVAYMRWSHGELPIYPIDPAEREMRFFNRIGLDKEQMQYVRDSRREFFEGTRYLADDLNRLRSSLFAAMHSELPDTAQIFGLVDSIGNVQNRLHREAITYIMNEGEMLTPRQKRKLLGMLEGQIGRYGEKHGHWRKHRGVGRGPRPPIGLIGLIGMPPFMVFVGQDPCGPDGWIYDPKYVRSTLRKTQDFAGLLTYNCDGLHRERMRQDCNKIEIGGDKSPEGGI